MPELVFVQMRESGPNNTVTYEVIDKRRPRADRLVAVYKTEARARRGAGSVYTAPDAASAASEAARRLRAD